MDTSSLSHSKRTDIESATESDPLLGNDKHVKNITELAPQLSTIQACSWAGLTSLLLLDEPTEGLQPSMISLIRKSILELKKQGVAILLVEQRVEAILSIADEILVIENGSIVYSAEANEVVKDHKKLYSFLGV